MSYPTWISTPYAPRVQDTLKLVCTRPEAGGSMTVYGVDVGRGVARASAGVAEGTDVTVGARVDR